MFGFHHRKDRARCCAFLHARLGPRLSGPDHWATPSKWTGRQVEEPNSNGVRTENNIQ